MHQNMHYEYLYNVLYIKATSEVLLKNHLSWGKEELCFEVDPLYSSKQLLVLTYHIPQFRPKTIV